VVPTRAARDVDQARHILKVEVALSARKEVHGGRDHAQREEAQAQGIDRFRLMWITLSLAIPTRISCDGAGLAPSPGAC
jgi:hypothetical protein